MKITTIDSEWGPLLHFEGVQYCPKCGWRLAPEQIACIACLPEMAEKRKREHSEKPKPDVNGLFAGDPGVKL
jgi:hypothetical protein